MSEFKLISALIELNVLIKIFAKSHKSYKEYKKYHIRNCLN